jgi:hypothetical protein
MLLRLPRIGLQRRRGGTGAFQVSFGREEDPMIKALLTPVILGLAVAMVIRVMMAPRT